LRVVAFKKLPIAIGLLLIFVGLILTSSYDVSVTSESWETTAAADNSWSITSNFNLGENFTLILAWSAITYGEDLGELPANVTITANNEPTTEFQVYFLQDPNSLPGQEQERQRIYVSRIELLHNDGNSLEVKYDPPKQIGGIVKQAGTFEVRVHPPPDSFPWAGYPEPQPPNALRLLKIAIKRTYPYRDLLPVGAITGAFGAIVLVWKTRPNRNAMRRGKLRANSR